ncbi:MAG: CPBP family intramembrane metalloprotease [Candidatus Brocadiae bacterium]|nr:CPBP family intramembrane metalloprotease [Candidatus Brocadiia bacterium]
MKLALWHKSTIPNKILAALALLIIALDLFFLYNHDFWLRMIPCFFFFLLAGIYYKTFPQEYGFQTQIQPSIAYWAKISFYIGVMVLAFCLLCLIGFKILQIPVPKYVLFRNSSEFRNWMLAACFFAPIVEETLYRAILCGTLEKIAGTTTGIAVSGGLFALLHFFYGNPAFDNFIAGYFLAWSFFRSKSILIPIFLHASGNAFVGLYYCIAQF